MAQEYFEILFRLVAALAAGSLIGLERSHRGRPAGFRTHALVCLASSLLMLVTVYETHWFPDTSTTRVILDPTRIAQGIMTGIGFVGAGAIIKEGFTVRGLTTAASIWVTAAIGILTGIGFYFAAVVGTMLALGGDAGGGAAEGRHRTRLLGAQPNLPARRRGNAVRVPHGVAQHGPRKRARPVRCPAHEPRGA
jgi:putative Mg2+ transporter-C (MgtC) family protein